MKSFILHFRLIVTHRMTSCRLFSIILSSPELAMFKYKFSNSFFSKTKLKQRKFYSTFFSYFSTRNHTMHAVTCYSTGICIK